MANLVWGDYSSSRSVEITPADVQVSTITAPVADSVHSTSVTVTYKLTSHQCPDDPELIFYVEFDKQDYGIDAETWVLADIQVEYSIDGGTTYTTCTEDTVAFSALSEGTENLLTSIAGVAHNYVWAMRTDMGTNDYLTNVYIRIKAYDGESWSAYLTSSAFTVDTVPIAPTFNSDSYDDGEKLKDTTPEFHFTIPTDIGSDRLHFKIDWDTDSTLTSTNLVSRNSYDNDGFWHYHNNVNPSGTYTANNYKKYGDWYFQITGCTTGGTYAFGNYKDYYKDIYLPAEFIDPKVIIYSNKDILYYVSGSSSTGVTVSVTSDSDFPDYDAVTGGTSTATLYCYLFEGAWGEYWISNITVSGATLDCTLGAGQFITDDNDVVIPTTLDEEYPIILQSNSDALFWITGWNGNTFTINKASDIGNPTTGDTCTVFISDSKTDVYWFNNVSLIDGIDIDVDSNGIELPTYIPGIQFIPTPTSKIMVINRPEHKTYMYDYFYREYGEAHDRGLLSGHANMSGTRSNAILFGCNADEFWTPITTLGIPDDYENEKAKFIVQSADAYTSGNTYYYRIAAGNT